ncbi:EAL domain-containing protein [Ectothiorhodospiraceae bacterium BW-2]|nr:EAL domain-containing protein [Ectothiorhodospiraceae bacterium BW-2]
MPSNPPENASDERFAKAFNHSTVAMAMTDIETGSYLDVNEAFCSTTGYRSEEALGRTSLELGIWKEPKQRQQLIEQVLAQGSVTGVRVTIRHRDGSDIHGVFSVSLLPLQQRQVLLTQFVDVTRQYLAEAALKAERDLFIGGPVVVLIWLPEPEWPILYASPNATHLFGYSLEALTEGSFPFSQLISPKDGARVGSEVEHYLAAGYPSWEQRYRIVRQDGKVRWLYDFTVVEQDSDGRVSRLRGYVMDETHRIASEERLRLASLAFEQAKEGIIICDSNGNIIEVNSAFSHVTGYSAVDAIGKNPRLLASGRHDSPFYRKMWRDIETCGYWQGELWNRKKSGELYACLMSISTLSGSEGGLGYYLAIFTDITENKRHQEKLELMAHFDALTSLPNRVLLADRLRQEMVRMRRKGQLLAVCYLDLDGFKPINDHYGHDQGDRVLIEIASRLKLTLREEDTVARIGGDEFVLLLTDLDSKQECEQIIQRLLRRISEPIVSEGQSMAVSGSIGITFYPEDNSGSDALLCHADVAMYRAKMAGRNGFAFYELCRESSQDERQQLLRQAEQALQRGEFELYYQPKVDMRHEEVVGMEALIRWNHSENGLMLPLQFLPQLEGDLLQQQLDWWVIQQAIAQLVQWQRQGLMVPVSVNLNGATLMQKGFIRQLDTLLQAEEIGVANYLELEIVETSALEDIEKISEIFRQCQARGMTIALDDFGTGFSSLIYFRRLPVDALKIDQQFIRNMINDPEDMAIVESVIGLSRAFGRQVVAEGVELGEVGSFLLQMGCDIAQGYAISQPLPAADVAAWIESYRAESRWHEFMQAQWSEQELTLKLLEREHRRWVSEVQQWLTHRPHSLYYPPLLDPHQCRVGRWLDVSGRKQLADHRLFIELVRCHDEVHQLARELFESRHLSDKLSSAQLEQFLQASEALLEILQQLNSELE